MPEISPRAYLRRIKNVRQGLLTRSRIIFLLSQSALTTQRLASNIGLSQSTIRRHLRNMAAEGIVEKRRVGGRVLWRLTGIGQRTLEEVAT